MWFFGKRFIEFINREVNNAKSRKLLDWKSLSRSRGYLAKNTKIKENNDE